MCVLTLKLDETYTASANQTESKESCPDMTLQQKLQENLKESLRNHDSLRLSVIRYLRSEIHNKEIASQKQLDDEEIIGLLSKQAQQCRDSIETFRAGNRQDLVEKEQNELAIILEYLPTQLSKDEIADIVLKVIDEIGAGSPHDTGKVMSNVMPRVKGKAPGKEVSNIVSELLIKLEHKN